MGHKATHTVIHQLQQLQSEITSPHTSVFAILKQEELSQSDRQLSKTTKTLRRLA